jgi:PadR family transcriptional regulator AphA
MSQDSRSPLPTTSYAILGMLALRPWTAYELTQQLRRSLSYCWPKAESVLYDEPKRLVRLGLATAQREPVGRRTRTAYAITGEGRRALGAWLAPPTRSSRFEFEAILRLLYADQGTKAELLDAVRAARRWAEERYAEGREQRRAGDDRRVAADRRRPPQAAVELLDRGGHPLLDGERREGVAGAADMSNACG